MFLVTITHDTLEFTTERVGNYFKALTYLSQQLNESSVNIATAMEETVNCSLKNTNTSLYLIETDVKDLAVKIAFMEYNNTVYTLINASRMCLKAETIHGVQIYIDQDTEELIQPYVFIKPKKIESSMLSKILETDIPFSKCVEKLRTNNP